MASPTNYLYKQELLWLDEWTLHNQEIKQALESRQQQQYQMIRLFNECEWSKPGMTERYFYSLHAGLKGPLTDLAICKFLNWLLTPDILESMMSQQERTTSRSGRIPKPLLAARSRPFLCHCEEPSQRAWGSGSNSDDPLPLPPCSWDADN